MREVTACSVDACELHASSLGLCKSHLNKHYRYGDPLGGPIEPTECANCGGELPPKGTSGPRLKYCTKQCQRAFQPARPRKAYVPKRKAPYEQFCKHCSGAFMAARVRAFCSQPCGSRWRRLNPTRFCTLDGCDKGLKQDGLCSMHFLRLNRSGAMLGNPAWTDARRETYHRRRALKKGASTGNRVVFSEICERDNWLCGICGDPVGRDVPWPDPLSPSLDHVIPLTKGGLHDPANVQLAHLRCNVSKGAKLVTVGA